jgi:hypothetical protein
MLRRTFAFVTAALSGVLLALLEPVLAASNAERLPLIALVAACFRSLLWLTNFVGGRRAERA